MKPFNNYMDLATGEVHACEQVVVRRLSNVAGVFTDRQAAQKLVTAGDPVVYRVFNVPVPEDYGHLQHCVSVIYPGKVGDEYFMTKGHFHARRETGEIYFTLKGEGRLLLESERGETGALDMRPGSISYIPPYWAHRTVNVGKDPLVFFAVYPGDAGHDYGAIEAQGFALRVVERDGTPTVLENPGQRKGG